MKHSKTPIFTIRLTITILVVLASVVFPISNKIFAKGNAETTNVQNQHSTTLVAEGGGNEPGWGVRIDGTQRDATQFNGEINLDYGSIQYLGTFKISTQNTSPKEIIFVGTLMEVKLNEYNQATHKSFAINFKKQVCRDDGDRTYNWNVMLLVKDESAKDKSDAQFFPYGEVGCGEVYMDE